MNFTMPWALLLLLTLPLVVWLGWPRQAYRRTRDRLSLVLRCALLLLLVLALAGAQLRQTTDRLAVVFLIDVSDSLGVSVQAAQLDYVRQALQQMGPDDRAGVVVFGAEPRTERALSAARQLDSLQAQPATGNTNLAAAIRHGIALLPNDAARRLVLLSDGQPTLGDAETAAQQAAALGIEISYVSFSREPGPEVQVLDLSVPGQVIEGQAFDLTVSIAASVDTPATVTVLDSGQIIQRQSVTLRAGTNSYTLPLSGASAGFKDFRVQVDPAGEDTFYQNNELATFTRVIGPPRVLLVAMSEAETAHLLPALQQAGFNVDQMTPQALPVGVAALAQYESVVLANVPATALSDARMTALDVYVRELGGGLVSIGGPDSYAPGGYFQTPLADTLPVEMRVRDQMRLPQLTIVYLIDRSGSMASSSNGVPNIEMAKEAIIRSVDFLQPTDRAGVVSFDSRAYWVAELQPVLDRLGLQRLVATLRASGGTDILAGMQLAAEEIIAESSERKHIILLTDGGAAPDRLVEIAQRLREQTDVTTSVISIGSGAGFLAEMARVGDGQYHEVMDAADIPTIFTLETVLASRSYLMEEPFIPIQTANSPIMAGISSVPSLLGYVATSPRQTAQTILTGPAPFHDPLLASWQYGLGRAVAFTSDATSRWGADWVNWPDFARFWGQAVRWTITEGAADQLEMQVRQEGEQARLIVDARDESGSFLNGLTLQASIIDPVLTSQALGLRQVAPGRYEALFTPQTEGAYFVGLSGLTGDEAQPVGLTGGWVLSYSREYDTQAQGMDSNLLGRISVLTGGQDMSADVTLPFVHNLIAQASYVPLWPWLVLLALLLLPLDIAVRRVLVTASDWQRLRQWLRPPVVEAPPTERLSGLMQAKQRGRQRAEGVQPPSTVSALRASRDRARQRQDSAPAASDTARQLLQKRRGVPRSDEDD